MTTLREAALQALEALESHPYDDRHWVEECQPAITALKAALAEPQDEPVAWANMKDGEPVLLSISQHPEDRANWMNPVPLYLHPAPQRQPLTDEQIRELSQQHKFDSRMEKFVRIIERAHGIGGQE